MPFPCASTLTPPFSGSFLPLEWRGIKSLAFQVLLRYTVHGVFMQPPPTPAMHYKKGNKMIAVQWFPAGFSLQVDQQVLKRSHQDLERASVMYTHLCSICICFWATGHPSRLYCPALLWLFSRAQCVVLCKIQSCAGFSPFPTIS